MCSIARDYTGHAESRYLCEEGALGTCNYCDEPAIVSDGTSTSTVCALHVLHVHPS